MKIKYELRELKPPMGQNNHETWKMWMLMKRIVFPKMLLPNFSDGTTD